MYQAWSIVWGRAALAGIAQMLGAELPEIEAYDLEPSRRAPAAESLVHMLKELRADAGDDEARVYEMDRPYRLALALQRLDALAPAFDCAEREEIGKILGHSVSDLAAANAELEQYVSEAGPEQDVELLRYFYRRTLREHELHRPALFEYTDRTLQALE